MSWQTYVDVNLVGTKKITKAAIIGQKGGVWASSPGYTISVEEQVDAVRAFDNPATTQASGIRLGGQKFFTIHADPRSVYGKKAADGCVLVKTTQAVLIAEYIAPTQAGEVTTIVEKLADYLISVQY